MVLIALLLPAKVLIFTILPGIASATILKCFKYYPNYYLGKNGNLVVVNISSVTSCLDHCLKSQLLYDFICRSAMVNKMQGECTLSKWNPNLAIINRYQSKVIYTDFYENICLSPLDQIPHFMVAPPRTTFSVPISNKRLLIQNSDDRINKNYKSIDGISDIIFNNENKKKPSFKIVFHHTQHIPSPNTVSGSIRRFVKHTVSLNKKIATYYADCNKDCNNYNGNNKDYDNSNDDNDDDDDDDDDYDDDYDDDDNDDSYKDNDTGSDAQFKDITYRIDSSLSIPVKSTVIKPNPVTNFRSFQSPLVEINSTVLFPSTTIITPLINVGTITAHAHITTIMAIVTVITTTITNTAVTSITTTTTATTITPTTIATVIIPTTIATATTTKPITTTITSTPQFIHFPYWKYIYIDKSVPRWNTTIKNSELSIQHQNYALNIRTIQQNSENGEMIRRGFIEQLKCFHHFANNRLNDYEQEIIEQIGLQDCLNNCISRVAFLCLSECILNGGNRIINNVQLISSKSVDYYEYVCLSARKQGSKAKSENFGDYNISKLRKCFSIYENAVMYTLNGFIVDNIYTPLECLMTCDRSNHLYKAKCYSVNWFKNTRICYLHTAKTNISDLKATISSDFFSNNCADADMILQRNADCGKDYCID